MKMIRRIKTIFIIILLLFLCLLIYSERWFLATWDSSIEFSTVVYQLFSPLKGTGWGVIYSYIEGCIYPMLLTVVFCSVVYAVLRFIKRNLSFTWTIDILGMEKRIEFRYGRLFRGGILFGVLCAMSGIIWTQAVEMGAVDYFEQLSKHSTLFEEEYVDPAEVDIRFPAKKRNLILIYLESMESTYASVDEGGGKPANYIPELTQLAFDNLFFSNDEDFGGTSYSNGTGWTMAAILASSAGIPYKLGIEGNTAELYEDFLPGVTALGDILVDNGYYNYFMCGSDSVFAGRRDFYKQHGDYTIMDLNTAKEEGIVSIDYNNGFWGLEDEKLFTYARRKLSDIAVADAPFNFTLLTVDTHHPEGYFCNLCENQYDDQYTNVLSCSSRQVGDFIEWVQAQPWYVDTTIVIIGDHLSMRANYWEDIGDYDRKIYNCFINIPSRLYETETKCRCFTTMDLFPSILAAMGAGVDGDRLGLGVNLFSEEKTIPEKRGLDIFNEQLGQYSSYYFWHFIAGK